MKSGKQGGRSKPISSRSTSSRAGSGSMSSRGSRSGVSRNARSR